jgi:hypothetical protein
MQKMNTGTKAFDAHGVTLVLLGLPIVKADCVPAAQIAAGLCVADGGIV